MRFSTTGCHDHNHPEFVFHCDAHSVPESDVQWLINFLETAVARGEIFRDGETIQIGWSIVRVSHMDDGCLDIFEPDMIHMPAQFVDSVTNTLRQLRAHKDTTESCLTNWQPVFPSIRDAIAVPARYAELPNVRLVREAPEGHWSGWALYDVESTKAQPEKHQAISLYELACRRPDLIMYLALPPGATVLLRTGDRIRIFDADVELTFHPGSLVDQLNRARQSGLERR